MPPGPGCRVPTATTTAGRGRGGAAGGSFRCRRAIAAASPAEPAGRISSRSSIAAASRSRSSSLAASATTSFPRRASNQPVEESRRASTTSAPSMTGPRSCPSTSNRPRTTVRPWAGRLGASSTTRRRNASPAASSSGPTAPRRVESTFLKTLGLGPKLRTRARQHSPTARAAWESGTDLVSVSRTCTIPAPRSSLQAAAGG